VCEQVLIVGGFNRCSSPSKGKHWTHTWHESCAQRLHERCRFETKSVLAVADHGQIIGDTVTNNYEQAHRVLEELEQVGVSYTEVVELLETEGARKFVDSWDELLETGQGQLDQHSSSST